MNKKRKRKNNRKGMTLIELLTVILILAILGALTTVAVVRHRRNLKLYEMDNTAKEIFVAAQNHLSVMKVEGLLPESGQEEAKVCHLVYNGKSASVISSNSEKDLSDISGTGEMTDAENLAAEEWEEMLPQGAIDETIRVNGSYIISYDPANAVIKDVFYSDKYQFSSTDFIKNNGKVTYSEELTKAETDKDVRKRFNNTNDVIGYYGGAKADSVPVESLHEPVVSVRNGDQLKVEVALNEADENRKDIGSVQLIVTIGNKKKVLAGKIAATASLGTSGRKNARTCTFLLDDVTASGSDQSTSKEFVDLFEEELKAKDSTYKLGEDISVQAVVLPENAAVDETGTKIISSGWSEKKTVNPLFAGVEDKAVTGDKASTGGKDSSEDGTSAEDQTAAGEKIAVISSFRHLINLQTFNDYKVGTGSQSKKLSISSAKQMSDMDWASFVKDGNVSNPDYSYVPLTLDEDFSYDGQYYRIVNLKIGSVDGSKGTGSGKVSGDDVPSSAASVSDGGDGDQAAGLFGSVSKHLTVQNVVLDDFDVYGSNAGALVGEVTEAGQLTVRGVLARAYDNSRRIHGTENAGGLIGRIVGSVDAANTNGSEISLSSASVYVEGGTNAGGLIGSAANTKIKDCYTAGHTRNGEYIQETTGNDVRMNVQATGKNGIAGGLVGSFSGSSSSVSASYSTASVYGKLAGTLIGSSDNATKIENTTVYGSGFAMNTDKQQVTALIGNNTGLNGCDYRSFKQGDRISYRYDAIANKDGEKSTIIGFALPGIPDLDTSLESADADTVPFFISSHFGDWKILDQVKEKKIYFVDFYTYDSEGKLVPYTDDPMVRFIQPKTRINRQGVMEGGSAYVPKEAPEGKFIESIDFYLTDTAVDNPDTKNLSENLRNTYDPNEPAGHQYTYAKDNNGTDKTDFSNVNKNIIAVVNLKATDGIAGRVQLKASFFNTKNDKVEKERVQSIAYPKVVDGKVTPVEPVYAGYTFKGWYSDENCTENNKLDKDNFGKIQVNNTQTIYARYEQNPSKTKTVAFVLEVKGVNGSENTSLGTMLAHTDSNTLGKIQLRNYKNITPNELYRWDGKDWVKVENPGFSSNPNPATLTLNDDLSSAVSYPDAGTDAAYKIVYRGDMVSYKVQYIFQNTESKGLNSNAFYTASKDGASYSMTQSVDMLPYSSNANDTFVIETTESTVKGMLATAKPLNLMDGDQGKFIQSKIEGNNVVLNGDKNDYTIKVYFTRKSYYLTYDFQSGIYQYTDSDGTEERTGMKASELHMYGETFNLLDDSANKDDSANINECVQKTGYSLAKDKEWYLVPDKAEDAAKSYTSLAADSSYPLNLDSGSLKSYKGFTMPAENVHVVANWEKNSTAPVTVEIFRQNVDHRKPDLYDYYTSFNDVGTFSTDSNQKIQLTNVFGAIADKEYAPSSNRRNTRFRDNDPDAQNGYPSYSYFDFNVSKTSESLPEEINPDGTTVIRLYYDREKINYVFDYSHVGGVELKEEKEATVSPVTMYKLTVTTKEVNQSYKYLTQGTDGTDLRYVDMSHKLTFDNGYFWGGTSFWGWTSVDPSNVVKLSENQYELVDNNTDTSSGTFYYAPEVYRNNGYYLYYDASSGNYKYADANNIYSEVTGNRTVTQKEYSWDNTGMSFSREYGTDFWNKDIYGNKIYFGHVVDDNLSDKVYYISADAKAQLQTDDDIERYLKHAYNGCVEFTMPSNDVDWSTSEPGKLVYPKGAIVNQETWTGLYEEPFDNYDDYKWPSRYSWQYSIDDGITFLAQFLPDSSYVDKANTIKIKGLESSRGNLTIRHYLQNDFVLLQDSDISDDTKTIFENHFGNYVISQKTTARKFQLTNKFLGYSVCAYDYSYDGWYKTFKDFSSGGTGTSVNTINGGTLDVYHKRNSYQIRIENTGEATAPKFDELYQQLTTSLDVSGFKENPPSNLGSGYIFTGLYDSKSPDAKLVFNADGNFVGDETTYGVDTNNDGKADAFQMPANNVQLFAHWEAPKVKVFFNLSGSSEKLKDLEACENAVKQAGNSITLVASDSEKSLYNVYQVTDELYYVEMSQDTATLDTAVKAMASLTKNLTTSDSDGNTYEFGAWSTAKDSMQEYIASSAVIDDFVLYPHWKQTAGTAKIQINVVGADGSSLLSDLDKDGWTEDQNTNTWKKDNWEFDTNQNILYWKGTMHTSGVIEAPAIKGYTPYVSSQTINDITPVSDPITFTYTSSGNVWTYKVNYVADFGSNMRWTIKSETHSSENASEMVTADLNLEGYYLKGILSKDGKNTVDPSAYKILSRNVGGDDDQKDSVPTVTFVYGVMKDEVFRLTGSSKLYDGKSCEARVTYIGEGSGMFAGLSRKTVIEYSEDGKSWTTDAPVYAGSYQVRARVIFKDKDGKEYTVWTDASDSSDQKVNIIPRSVFLESASYVFAQQDNQDTYRNTTVRVRGDGFLKGDGVKIHNPTSVPKGTSALDPNNYFTYTFVTTYTKTQAYYERNYNIQRIFGTLRVQTKADPAVNAEWGTPNTAEDFTLSGT